MVDAAFLSAWFSAHLDKEVWMPFACGGFSNVMSEQMCLGEVLSFTRTSDPTWAN